MAAGDSKVRDGTLLDSAHRLQAAVADALGELDARGVKVVLATARSPQVTRVVLRQLKLAPLLVCFSGAWIGEVNLQSPTTQKTLWEKRHTASAARLIVETALSHDVEPNVFTRRPGGLGPLPMKSWAKVRSPKPDRTSPRIYWGAKSQIRSS